MFQLAELRERVASAERAWSSGEWAEGCQRFRSLATEIVSARLTNAVYGFNESLVLQRFASISAERGHLRDALDTYGELQQHARAQEDRALAAFRRLDLAVSAGDGLLASETYRWIAATICPELPADVVNRDALTKWEGRFQWSGRVRAMLFAAMYLAVGRMSNAQRRLDHASAFFARGIEHAQASDDDEVRVNEIPLHLALAQTQLTLGNFLACGSTLRVADDLITERPSGSIFLLWHRIAEARLALVQGHLATALERLQQAEALGRQRRQTQAVCRCLLSRAELLILLNLLAEADECLLQLDHFAAAHDRGIRAALVRARFLRVARAEALSTVPSALSAAEMMAGTARTSSTPGGLQALLDDAAVVWTGDCLQDYEIRETAIYANFEDAPNQASRDLEELWRDFGRSGSRLIDARLHAATGLFFSRLERADAAADPLQRAYDLCLAMGAERDAYQVTLFLARAYRQVDPAKAESLLAINDRRLTRLTDGLSVEQRNAFVASRYTATEEQQRMQIQSLLALRATATLKRGWRKALATMHYWRALHGFIAALDREQEQRRKTLNPHATRWVVQDNWRGLACRLTLHPWRTLTTGYVALPDQIFMFETRCGWMDCRTLNIGRPAIESLHRSLAGDDPPAFDAAATRLCERLGLQQTFDRTPARIRSLRVVADAALHLIPFCALRYRGRDGKYEYLVERVAVTMATVSAPASRDCRSAAGRAIVAHYAGMNRPLHRAEPAARAAATRLARDWNLECRHVTDRETCLSLLSSAAVLFYFGHGHFDASDVDASGIEFGDPSRTPDSTGLISLRDLDGVDLTRMRHAIVFACHGSDAVPYAGRWAVGLPHMLLRRGARSVLASMWETAPEIAEEVSDVFLERARRVGCANALREAQLRVLRSGRGVDPFWWAAFQLYGDDGRP